MINEKVTVEKAKELASKIRVEQDGVVFGADLRMPTIEDINEGRYNLPDYNLDASETIIYAYVCHCYENKEKFSYELIAKKYNVSYKLNFVCFILNSLEKKGYVYRNAYYLPIYAPKSEDKYYIDVIKFLIRNSKRYNEENLYINVIDCLISDISDVEFCYGCKHYKGEGDCFCDMCGEKDEQDALCRNSLIERAKKGELKIKEN